MRTLPLLLLMLLAACAPTPAQPSAARQAIAATQQAVERQAEWAARAAVETQMALETQQVREQERAEIQVTAQAQALTSQQTQQAFDSALAELQLTSQYLQNQEGAVQVQLTQVAGWATTTAIVAESAERAARVQSEIQRQEITTTSLPVLLCLLAGGSGSALIWGIVAVFQARRDVIIRRGSIIETAFGPVLVDGRNGDMAVMLLNEPEIAKLPAPSPKPTTAPRPTQVWTSPAGGVAFSRRGSDSADYRLVRDFLRNAAAAAGPLSTQFPRHDKMAWRSDRWQQAKNILEEADLVRSEARRGTYVNAERYPNIGALSAAIHARREQF